MDEAQTQHETKIRERMAKMQGRAAKLHDMSDTEKIEAVRAGRYTRQEVIASSAGQGKTIISGNHSDEVLATLYHSYGPLLAAMRRLKEMGLDSLLSLNPIAQSWKRNAPACDAPGSAYLVHSSGFSVIAPEALGIDSGRARSGLRELFRQRPASAIASMYRAMQAAQALVWRRDALVLREAEVYASIMSEYGSFIENNREASDIAQGWREKLGLQSPSTDGGRETGAAQTAGTTVSGMLATVAAETAQEQTEPTEDYDYGSGPGL